MVERELGSQRRVLDKKLTGGGVDAKRKAQVERERELDWFRLLQVCESRQVEPQILERVEAQLQRPCSLNDVEIGLKLGRPARWSFADGIERQEIGRGDTGLPREDTRDAVDLCLEGRVDVGREAGEHAVELLLGGLAHKRDLDVSEGVLHLG